MAEQRSSQGNSEDYEGLGRKLGRILGALDTNQRLAGLAAIALIVSLALPWFTQTGIERIQTLQFPSAAPTTRAVSVSLTGFQSFKWIEAALLLVACAVLLMLAAMRRLLELDAATRAGRGWPTDASLGETVRDIGGCTVGLVGYGNIAQRVERIVAAMGARVLHTSTRDDGTAGWRPLRELLAESDIVSLHLPLTPETDRLIDRVALDSMKPNALLINTSRGAIVDESALEEALQSRRLAAAGLDVFAVEPVTPDNPLLRLDNVVVTPHVVWYTQDTMRRYLAEAIDNCRRLRDGQDLVNVVNGRHGVRIAGE
jgi:hypothetical protein